MDAFDRNWGIQAAGVVNEITFNFIDFDEIVDVLPKLRVRFPNVCVSLNFSEFLEISIIVMVVMIMEMAMLMIIKIATTILLLIIMTTLFKLYYWLMFALDVK